MLKRYVADLHVHTVLSPCAEYRMVPELIVEKAIGIGVDLLGIADHNSGENVGAVVVAARNTNVAVLPGMEVESREGVHILTYFDTVEALYGWQEAVYAALPDRPNDEKVFGAQLVVDAVGSLLGVNRRLLLTAVDMSIEEIAEQVRCRGGICVPAHVDRPAYGLLGVLGLVPDGLPATALEISPRLRSAEARKQYPQLCGWALLNSSDAHSIDDVGRASTCFIVDSPTIREIASACRNEGGRAILG